MTETNTAQTAQRNEVVVTMEGRDITVPMDSLQLNIGSSERDILAAVRPLMQEQEGFDIADGDGEFAYTVRKAMNSNTIYVYPKPVAG